MRIDCNLSNIIKMARADTSQAEFASKLGKTQSQISKYERGQSSPPRDVVEYCLGLTMPDALAKIHTPSSDELSKLVKSELDGLENSNIRKMIYGVLNGIG